MPGIVLVGLQFGDEGKGKMVDLLGGRSSHIVRSQGGNNAGHTVLFSGKEIPLHLIPSGVLYPHTRCYIAGGCLVDPKGLIEEIRRIETLGIPLVDKLYLSPYAHIVFPFHRDLDHHFEMDRVEQKEGAIGTTGRGIGPTVADRAYRDGIRVAELMRPDIFKNRLEKLVRFNYVRLGKTPEEGEKISAEIFDLYMGYAQVLRPFVAHVEDKIRDALIRDETVLFEGAHGTFLDNLFGSYPYVTSSFTTSSGVCASAGIGPRSIDEVFGVIKAYTTRVGAGPLPTAVDPSSLKQFEEAPDLREVGTTTGRKRRIGWLDLVLVRHAVRLNGVDVLGLTKLDVLDGFKEIKVCTGYKIDGEVYDIPPPLAEDFALVEPIYEIFPGWCSSTRGAKTIRDLPRNARSYIDAIADNCSVSISIVSVGPSRDETIEIDEEWM